MGKKLSNEALLKREGIARLFRECAPHWDASMLCDTIRMVMQYAKTSPGGAWLEAPLFSSGMWGVIAFDLDGEGGVIVNEETGGTILGREIVRVMQIVHGRDRIRMGRWKDGKAVLADLPEAAK